MAILKIARMGHPVLRQPTTSVDQVSAPEIQRLISDMQDTLAEAQGVGLAAPQVYVSKAVMMFFVPPSRAGDDTHESDGVPLTVLINPEIEPCGDERVGDWEGCLSIPGLQGYVPRWQRIRYRGLDAAGLPIEREAEGFHARVVQHEYDHLCGVLYPERMTDMTRLGFAEELRRHPMGRPGAKA
ncbi:peptide deformylase [Salinisphaera sp. SPP-AMP-43]|uniref:peptide deformylase n=1 Tax=Salinisphaera sp. SPP-AMP-43 TaxID=3121288 RepID=UPI003C6DD7B8